MMKAEPGRRVQVGRFIWVFVAGLLVLLAGYLANLIFVVSCISPEIVPSSPRHRLCHYPEDAGPLVIPAVLGVLALISAAWLLVRRELSMWTRIALVATPALVVLVVPILISVLPAR